MFYCLSLNTMQFNSFSLFLHPSKQIFFVTAHVNSLKRALILLLLTIFSKFYQLTKILVAKTLFTDNIVKNVEKQQHKLIKF